MQKSSIRKVCALLLLLLVSAIASPKAYGSSNIATGRFRERAPAPAAESGDGICRFFTGPRGDSLGDGEFLLDIGDSNVVNGYELELKGTFTQEGDRFRLSPDDASARAFFEGVLRRQLGDPNVAFDLASLEASVTKPPPARVTKTRPNRGFDEVTCKVHLSGRVSGLSGGMSADSGGSKPVSLTYRGLGQSFEASALQGNGCSTPSNLAPGGNCPDGTGCLLSFAGFKWWTSYNFFADSGFWNNNNIWSPRNASVDSDGLHLFVRKDNVGQGERFMAGEVVALFNDDGTAAALGFGTYLVTALVKSATSWDKLDPNVAFGAFTYERERGTVTPIIPAGNWIWLRFLIGVLSAMVSPHCVRATRSLLCKFGMRSRTICIGTP